MMRDPRISEASMHTAAATLLGAAVVLGVLLAFCPAARAQAYGERSAVNLSHCDDECLFGFARRYMDALVHHDPGRVPFARDARFTENDIELRIGDGLWGSIGSASDDPLLAADPETGNVAWFGTVEEHGSPAYYAMRLKVVGGRITQVETVVDRKLGLPAPFGDPAKLVHDPAFATPLEPSERRERERLRDVANGYFSTIERNDGDVLTLFDPDCQRIENGISTTRGSYGSAALAQGCEPQFKLGYFRINKRVRERRYPLIDLKRGIVVGTGFFDHDNSFDHYKTTDGKEQRTFLKWPNSLSLMEAFKIRNGRIYRVEAVFTYVPYFMHSPWAEMEPLSVWPAPDEPAAGAPSEGPAPRPADPPCDGACLAALADRYMRALAQHDPASLPWAAIVRYREDGVSMPVGEGQWSTVTGVSGQPLIVTDPADGTLVWLGTVLEHGDPAAYAMRLKVRDGRITGIESIFDPKQGGGPFGEPAPARSDRGRGDAPSANARSPRERMTEIAQSYIVSRLPTGDALRDVEFPAVDAERGLVAVTGFLDHPASIRPSAAESAGPAGHAGARARDAGLPYPTTMGFFEVLAVRNGKVEPVAAVSTFLPYRTPSAAERTVAGP
jgi:hypothetical protein